MRPALAFLLVVLTLAGCGSDSASPEDKARDADSELTSLLEPLPEDERAATKDAICTGIQVGYSEGDWEAALTDPELRADVMELQATLAETEGANTAFVEMTCS